MDTEVIQKLIDDFGARVLTWVPESKNRPYTGSFIVRCNPLPPQEEITLVMSDLINEVPVVIYGGKVRHDEECLVNEHPLGPEVAILTEAMKLLREETFVGTIKYYAPLPEVIILNPEISLKIFPDHPHINLGGPKIDSLCYEKDSEKLGLKTYERMHNAICQTVIWLFRHQIWLATKKITGQGLWIGPEAKRLPSIMYLGVLDPDGLCWCGKSVRYRDCHMITDIMAKDFLPKIKARPVANEYKKIWLMNSELQCSELKDLRKTVFSEEKPAP